MSATAPFIMYFGNPVYGEPYIDFMNFKETEHLLCDKSAVCYGVGSNSTIWKIIWNVLDISFQSFVIKKRFSIADKSELKNLYTVLVDMGLDIVQYLIYIHIDISKK